MFAGCSIRVDRYEVVVGRRESMIMTDKKKSGPAEAVKGVVEGVKGKTKEAAGAVTGQDDMVREGKAQQAKGSAQREAAAKEAEAEKARGKASAQEARQRAHQDK